MNVIQDEKYFFFSMETPEQVMTEMAAPVVSVISKQQLEMCQHLS